MPPTPSNSSLLETGLQPEVIRPSFLEALRFWFKLGWISFGGPAGQIAIMHRELVENKKWIHESSFLRALNFCMLLPGPEAQQLATYCGWLLHRTWGGIVAGTLFVLPSIFILWSLSAVYVYFGEIHWVASIFGGLQPAVLAIVISAVWRIGSKALKNKVMWTLAGVAFVSIYFFKVPFPAIVFGAGIVGAIGEKFWKKSFLIIQRNTESTPAGGITKAINGDQSPSPWIRILKIAVFCLCLWVTPLSLAWFFLGPDHVFVREGLFFSKAAMVTFGGAYAVLPYVAQHAIFNHWLTPPQMLAGLGLAETTPGPLIMVVQFVGFLGAWNHPGAMHPLLSATLGALITTWCTFVPCFLWIFLGAPYIERLKENDRLSCALSAVTAAVVGVILNLAVWFGWHVIVPEPGNVNFFAIMTGIGTLIALQKYKLDIILVLVFCSLAGLIHGWL